MSYNSTYYKSGPSGPSRGGRGSFRSRGSSDGGSNWQGRGRGRGNFSSGVSRGGSSTTWYNKQSTTFTKPSTTFNRGYGDRNVQSTRESGDRFVSRGADDYAHRYNRQDAGDNYSSRNDHSHHHRSPEDLPRKRLRTDSYSGDSNRRSHDSSYEYNSNRFEYSSEKSSYGGGGGGSDDRGRAVYREDRRPAAPQSRRDEFPPRTRDTSASSMPPPSQSYRGSTFRGRGGGAGALRGRGASTRGSFVRRSDATFGTHRTRIADSYRIRRRILVPKQDFFKSKLQKLRSFGANRTARKEIEVHSEDEQWPDDEDMENGEKAEKSPEKKKRPVKIVKKIIKKVLVKKEPKAAETKTDDSGAAETNDEKAETKSVKAEEAEPGVEEGEETTAPDEEVVEEEAEEEEEEEMEVEEEEEEDLEEGEDKKGDRKVQVTIKRDTEGRAVTGDKGKAVATNTNFIKLQCPHCRARCITFKDYQQHLRSTKHIAAMREVAQSMRQTLVRMRMEQRSKQRVIEEAEELQGIASSHTNFCPTCKLNYRQDRERHIASEMHKKMKDYLMPFCSLCHLSFKSPMVYENHICSLDHIRTKERSRQAHDREIGSLDVEKDVDMDDLLILDSVGSADESGESENEEDGEKDKSEETKKERKAKEKKHEINLGADYVRKVEVMYCDLCEIYLPRREQLETALASHCRTRNHLQRYVRYRDDCKLRREAERIHRRDKAEQEARSKKEPPKTEKENGEEKKNEKDKEKTAETAKTEKQDETAAGTASSEETAKKGSSPSREKSDAPAQSESADAAESEEKIWADVDKGLEELLQEVGTGCKSSDEDEDSGRYDRFKYSKADDGDEDEDTDTTAKPVKVEASEAAAE